jgi:hypothetical protein
MWEERERVKTKEGPLGLLLFLLAIYPSAL